MTLTEFQSLDPQTPKEVSYGETMQWFDQNPTLELWLPVWLQAWQRAHVISLMHWAEVMWAKDDFMSVFMCTPPEGTRARPCMKWIRMNSESLPIAEFPHILSYAAKKFHDTVGWCCVYSPKLYEALAKLITNSTDGIVEQGDNRCAIGLYPIDMLFQHRSK